MDLFRFKNITDDQLLFIDFPLDFKKEKEAELFKLVT